MHCVFNGQKKVLQISKAALVSQLYDDAFKLFGIEERESSSLEIYNYLGEEKSDVLKKEDTVYSSRLLDFQHILIDKKDSAPKKVTPNQPKVNVQYGLTGLLNLGNTCYMNAAIQCLSHTQELTKYFLSNRYLSEVNKDNVLGCKGELVEEYAELMKSLWNKSGKFFIPKNFHWIVCKYGSMFEGHGQHDSQEFMAFLLDGLHEDLNRVKVKVNTTAIEVSNNDDLEEAAKRSWKTRLARDNSFIMDLFQAQLKSVVECPDCHKVSITFDPFMFLSVPLPSKRRYVTVDLLSGNSFIKYSVPIRQNSNYSELKKSLEMLSGVKSSNMIIAEVYKEKFHKVFRDSMSTNNISSTDIICAYEIEDKRDYMAIPVLQRRLIPYFDKAKNDSNLESQLVGLPFFVLLKSKENYQHIKKLIREKLKILMDKQCYNFEFTISIVNSSGKTIETLKPYINEDITIEQTMFLSVDWDLSIINKQDNNLSFLKPEIHSSCEKPKTNTTVVSLYDCLDLFTEKETLTKENSWYCSNCKDHKEATKQLSVWNAPNILLIHLKRFSNGLFTRSKVDSFIDFPIHDLDISKYVESKSSSDNYQYELYAIVNHFGNIIGGHYTSFGKYFNDQSWYHFDDSNVTKVDENSIKTSSAYVLCYKKKQMNFV